MKKTMTRLLSLLLALITVCGLMIAPASAASGISVSDSASTVKVDTSNGQFYVVKTDNAKLKTKASWYGSTYATFTKGSLILANGTSGDYYKVKLGGTNYYIHKDDVKAAGKTFTANIDYVTKNNAPFRTGPAEKSSCSYTLTKGATFCLVGGMVNSAGNYWEIVYKSGKLYYVYSGNCARMCATVSLTVKGNADTVDIRSSIQLSASYDPSNTKNGITWSSSNPAVAAVSGNGVVTGVSAGTAVITATDKVIPGLSVSVTVTVSPRVQLAVGLLKQTDSRWKNKYYGGSSADIGRYGCLLTSLTMTYNYLYNQNATPDTFDDLLTFTSGGCVYWDSVETRMNYTRHSYSLTQIYEALKQGKPVIVGGENSDNSHWVVVTGYTGSGDLSAADFVINDSGANRTTLKQFLDKYPYNKVLVY